MAESNSRKFLKGAAILASAGLIVKVIGAFFRIPLNNWIGPNGMSYYGAAYSIYSVLIVMATAGFPVAISRLVSGSIAKKEYRNAHRVFHVAAMMMAVVGAVMFLICFFGNQLIANLFRNPEAAAAIRAISPALFFVPLLSAFRGYFNGRQNMNPSAISEIMEQVFRMVIGLALAWILLKKSGIVQAAAGASFGASAGAIGGLLAIWLIYLLNKRVFGIKIDRGSQRIDDTKSIAKTIAWIAVPIIIGSEIMPIMNFIDTSLIMRVLQDTGWTMDESKYLYGLLSGFCTPLIGFPQFVTQAITISLVPAVSRNFSVGDMQGAHTTIRLGYRTTLIMAFPCAVGLIVLAEPIMKLLYYQQPEACHDAVPTLIILAVGVVFLAVMQTSTSILQAVGKQTLPVRNLMIGCVGKIIVTYVLVGIHAVNVNGAAIGTILAYLIAMVLNAMAVRRYTKVTIDYGETYLRPFAAAAVMGAGAWLIHFVLAHLTGGLSVNMSNAISTGIAVLAAVVIYAVMIFAVHAITMEEVEELPHGASLAKLLRKIVPGMRR